MKSILLLVLISIQVSFAGGIRGTVKSNKGEILPYASIVVKGTSYGTMANSEGKYELSLLPGSYEVVFQYLGYKATAKKVEIQQDFITFNAELEEQLLALQEVKVKSANEDPANTIMRKAIAMAKIHTLEVDGYSARAYSRGGGKLTNIPGILENKLKKEGIEEGTVYFTETLTDLTFNQPNRYFQKVISTRSNFDDFAGYNRFFNASFYSPEVANSVSPLSPKAFGYYRFEYLGTFTDRGQEISKIKVTPRSKGDRVFEGTIYIIENLWSIHSLNLSTYLEGFRFDVKQLFSPVQEVWMPVNFQIIVSGGMFGFKGQFNYNVTVNNYKLKVNQKFHKQIDLVDEKIDKTPITVDKVRDQATKKLDLEKTLTQNKELNRKQLNKLLKEYEKQEKKEIKKDNSDESKVVSRDSIVVDSLARRRTKAFWDTIRTVPLTEVEIKSTIKLDSVKVVQKEKETKDSTKKNTNKFQFEQILFGHEYPLGKADSLKRWRSNTKYAYYRTKLIYESPLSGSSYNTVEGYRMQGGLGLSYDSKTNGYWKWMNYGRYAFAREKLIGYTEFSHRFKRNNWSLAGGKTIQQFNPDEAITEQFNSILTFLLERNYLKIFEKQFVRFNFESKRSEGLAWKIGLEYQKRFPLENQSNRKFIDIKNREYSSNIPVNHELSETQFTPHQATLFNAQLSWRPVVRYRIRNGRKQLDYSSSPEFTFRFRGGLPDVLGSQVNYQNLDVGLRHDFEIGVRGRMNYAFNVGTFLNTDQLYFMDYKHFAGNLAPIAVGDAVTSYRMLDYYAYSTKGSYFEAHGLFNFRKFLITRIPIVRISGLKENVFAHYLYTQKAGLNYVEIGYGLDGILRLLRAEIVANFVNGQYQHVAIRLGLNSKIQIGGK